MSEVGLRSRVRGDVADILDAVSMTGILASRRKRGGMRGKRVERKLAAILAADLAGYSRPIQNLIARY